MEDIETAEEDSFQTFFVEKDEIIQLICNIDEVNDTSRIIEILQKYQEQPHLLDTHLPELTRHLMSSIRSFLDSTNGFQDAPQTIISRFKIAYMLTKVRDYKTIIKLFPHETVDLERTVRFLERYMNSENPSWEVQYILFLWLKIIVLIPFNLNILDSQDSNVSLRERLLLLGKNAMHNHSIISRSASEFLSTLLSRSDYSKDLQEYLDWAKSILLQPVSQNVDLYLVNEVIYSLCCITRKVERHCLIDFSRSLLSCTFPPMCNKKNVAKLYQCLGLVLLKPRVPKWKYNRFKQSLEKNLGGATPTLPLEQEEIDDEYDIPEEIETILGLLLDMLKDKQTVVRWCAAKGIARITNRLPLELADEIFSSILDLYTPYETDATIHGACLTTAELIRRGLVLPNRIPSLIPKIILALQFEQRRGNFLTGSHVRDAACYVCWSLARTYEPSVMTEILETSLASALIVTSLFDREVNCRRAAAAAFQEHVGRQGNFPNGIDIIGVVNFFSLGNRRKSYVELAIDIASYDAYRPAIINHLTTIKYKHSDSTIRDISAEALGKLVPMAPDYFIKEIIPAFIKNTTDKDIYTRHGSLLSLHEILKAIALINISLGEDIESSIADVPYNIESKNLHKGKGGEWIRIALCKYIESVSILKIPLKNKHIASPKNKSYVTLYMEILENILRNTENDASNFAADSLHSFFKTYFPTPTPALCEKITKRWIALSIKEPAVIARGYFLGLGSLTRNLTGVYSESLFSTLLKGMNMLETKDVETRRNSIVAVTKYLQRNSLVEEDKGYLLQVLESIIQALDDYTTDNRGDIGSMIRETALQSFISLVHSLMADHLCWISDDIFTKFIQKSVKQLFEKIDRTREIAGKSLHSLFQMAEIRQRYPNLNHLILEGEIHWGSISEIFPRFIILLEEPDYRENVLLGLIRSIGGKNNHKELVEASVQCFTDYLENKASAETISLISGDIIHTMKEAQGNENDITTIARTIESLLSTSVFQNLQPSISKFSIELADIIQSELKKATLSKLLAFSPMIALMLSYDEPIRSICLKFLLKFLGFKYPSLRKLTAESFYLQLECQPDIIPDENISESIKDILLTTSWELDDNEAYNVLVNLVDPLCK